MNRLPADAPVWQRAPWNDPKLCPTCGRRAEVQVGGRGYCTSCARAMRLFLSALRVRTADPLEVAP